mgnify:FL=1
MHFKNIGTGQHEVKSCLSKEQVCDEEYLRGGEEQVDGEVIVCVGRVVVDPELPQDRGQHRRRYHHPADQERLKKNYES